ncbi:hypothetical protein SSX86_000827 [Deinandra increscens subsp. villosa]|uniref:Malectin-like domain-containing protein n=1 Tax=Deinandra increscens subsp. villosa TaxID=3103831 RepID=A0AAP0DUY6_9ASTR
MENLQQIGLPVIGIVAAAAVTFYVVSFSELREKSLNRDWDEDESGNGGFKSTLSSRGRRARRKSQKQSDRIFLPDYHFLSNPDQESVTTPKSQPILASTYGSSLHTTARILNKTSNFTFSINQHGRHFIRLYFFPFDSNSQIYNLSSSKFSVSAQGVTLLMDFQPDITPTVKEYSLNINSDKLVITFVPSANSLAFINALEVVSHPYELIPISVQTVELPRHNHNLITYALETMARINMGNQTVYPDNDTSCWIF